MEAPSPLPRTRVTAHVRSLRFDAGGLALNLVATLGRRGGAPVERMGTVALLREWCAGAGLRPAREAVGEALLAELTALREAAYDIVLAHLRGSVPALPSVALVNECAHTAPPAPRLELGEEGVRAEEQALSGRQVLSLVARDLIEVMGSPERRAALRECAFEACGMVYLDTTPGRRRRWCSMRRCGNTAKAAKHRDRDRDRHRAPGPGRVPDAVAGPGRVPDAVPDAVPGPVPDADSGARATAPE
ncbi:ABATE domain-containing protein [Streptomyces sp. HPF1205]|uniref:CGNR zinc finger domain-containing protein n=1 Tax=Streptomyces sp. HPF1205 TaxID=2873262 RepID=UPI001CEDEE85|nr:CGNR zinc finger domain-containing protein [Streptomyces sp. HPF1205]